MNYLNFFDFKSEPFSNEIAAKNLMKLPTMLAIKERMDYTIQLGGVMVITGDVGSGKSTSVRWASTYCHSSQHVILNIVATGGALTELYKQMCWALEFDFRSSSRAQALKLFRQAVKETVMVRKQKVTLIIDEASLLRSSVFEEIHTLNQFEQDSKNMLSIILVGQTHLMDKLMVRTSMPLASRVVTRTHLSGLKKEEMKQYLDHHLQIAGAKKSIFTEASTLAIQQGSGGILRKANSLARGSLIAASEEKKEEVTPEHVRIASTELI